MNKIEENKDEQDRKNNKNEQDRKNKDVNFTQPQNNLFGFRPNKFQKNLITN